MKRLVFAVAVLGLMACAKQESTPAADTTAVAPAAAPAAAPADSATMATDTMKAGEAKKE